MSELERFANETYLVGRSEHKKVIEALTNRLGTDRHGNFHISFGALKKEYVKELFKLRHRPITQKEYETINKIFDYRYGKENKPPLLPKRSTQRTLTEIGKMLNYLRNPVYGWYIPTNNKYEYDKNRNLNSGRSKVVSTRFYNNPLYFDEYYNKGIEAGLLNPVQNIYVKSLDFEKYPHLGRPLSKEEINKSTDNAVVVNNSPSDETPVQPKKQQTKVVTENNPKQVVVKKKTHTQIVDPFLQRRELDFLTNPYIYDIPIQHVNINWKDVLENTKPKSIYPDYSSMDILGMNSPYDDHSIDNYRPVNNAASIIPDLSYNVVDDLYNRYGQYMDTYLDQVEAIASEHLKR